MTNKFFNKLNTALQDFSWKSLDEIYVLLKDYFKMNNKTLNKFPAYKSNYTRPNFLAQNKISIIIIFAGSIIIFLPFIADVYKETNTLNIEGAAQFGDFVGGFIGTIFSLVSVVLLYLTLKDQRIASTVEKFETKYFELIKMHRENVNEMSLKDVKGKKIFVLIIREFREIITVTNKIANLYHQSFTQEQIFIISYYALFYGVGPNSSRMLIESLKLYDDDFVSAFERELNNKDKKAEVARRRKLDYVPFEGHQSRLGHYYRHLYQSIKYVDIQRFDIDKYEYVKTMRAQLTTHEQALLFLNSLTPLGKPWWDDGLLIGYKLVKNTPEQFFDKLMEIDMLSYFPDDYFEWQPQHK